MVLCAIHGQENVYGYGVFLLGKEVNLPLRCTP